MEKIPDEQIIRKLQSANHQKIDEGLKYLYKRLYQTVVRMVKTNSGGEDDAADVFQDALITLLKLVQRGHLDETTNVEGYLYAICRNLWLKQLKKNQRSVELTDDHKDIPVQEMQLYTLIKEEHSGLVQKLLKAIGENCFRLLSYYYYDRRRMREIAELMGFSSEQVAKNKKSACMKKLRVLLQDHPHYKDLLK